MFSRTGHAFALSRGRLLRSFKALAYLGLVYLLWGAPPAHAQNVQHTGKSADQALRSDLKINPSTHGLELQIPLAGYPGRAGRSVPVAISYSSKLWRVKYAYFHPQYHFTGVTALYAEDSRAGWTSSLAVPVIDFDAHSEYYSATGQATGGCHVGGESSSTCCFIDRVMARMPDGSSHELRSADGPYCYNTNSTLSPSLPDDLYAVDGSRTRYRRSTRELFLPNGSRYVLSANGATAQFIDRNGNRLSYANGQWTDTLGRTIPTPPMPSTPGDYTYAPPGLPTPYTFRWRSLSAAGVLSPGQQVSYITNNNCPATGQTYSPYLFGGGSGSGGLCFANQSLFDPVVLHQIVLPTGQTYTFNYNSFGEVSKLTYPSGGYERFEYGGVDTATWVTGAYASGNRGVVSRFVSASGSGADEVAWQYDSGAGSSHIDRFMLREIAPDGTLVERLMHRDANGDFGFGYGGAMAGRAYEERVYSPPDGSGNRQMLRRRLTEWSATGTNSSNAFAQHATRNARVTKEVEILLDTGGDALAKTTVHSYDTTYQFSTGVSLSSTAEYDFVAVSQSAGQTTPIGSIPVPAQWLRATEYEYLDTLNAAYRDRNILGLITATRVKNSAGTVVSRTAVSYDQYALTDRPGITQHESAYSAGSNVRGNPTSVTAYADAAGATGAVTSTAHYDIAGNVVSKTDQNGNTSQVSYADAYSDGVARNTFAYPTQANSPVPDPTGQKGSATPLTTSTVYDFSTGLVTSTTDANGQSTTVSYADPDTGVTDALNRVRKVTRPDGGWTRYDYGVAGCGDFVRTRTKLNAAGTLSDAYQCFDGLGRGWRSLSYDPQDGQKPWLTSDIAYDALGRAWKVSNTYRSVGGDADEFDSGVWTETEYDALGRVKGVTNKPDDDAVTTDYSGNQALVTDQDGKQRISRMDALGRLTDVWEVRSPDAATAPVTFPGRPEVAHGYRTTYAYDALGNLRKVDQGGQIRFFMYDSLGRLKRVRSSEQSANASLALTDPVTGNSQWSMAYGYDAAGNLISRTDPRGVTTAYAYDALGRSTTVDYSDTTGVSPDVKHSYDMASGGMGLRWQSEKAGATGTLTTVVEYDPMGRPKSQDQQFKITDASGTDTWGTAFNTRREYDLAGNVTSQTYPSGRKVDYTYDAAGRLLSFAGRLGDGVLRTYADQFRYDDGGRIEQERFGTATPVFNKSFHNRRGQLAEIRVSTHPITAAGGLRTDYDRGAIINHYSNHCWGVCGGPNDKASDNNGNLRRQDVYIPNGAGGESLTTQIYEYDALNRLDAASEVSGGVTQWRQDYTYDRWGNRTLSAAGTWLGHQNAAPSELVNEKQYDGSELVSTNRLYAPGDAPLPMSQRRMQYDASGNLVKDTYTGAGTRAYDAEGRMTSAQDSAGQVVRYTYDADGHRVRRKEGSTAEVWQVYGFDGELLAEYAYKASHLSPKKEYGYRGGALLVTAEGAAAPQETNLALNKTAAQSSTYSHATNPVAAKAVDGNTDGNFFNSSVSHTNSEAQAWWRVDLGGVQQVNTIKVWNRSDCCADRLTNFYVLVSDVPFTSNDLQTTLAQPGVSAYLTSGQGGRPTSVAVNRTGRYVRVQLAGTNYLGLAEVEVLGVAPSEPVQWTNAVGVTASGNSLTKPSTGALAWDSGATSTKAIASGDGYVEFTATETDKNRMAGLSHGDPNQSYDEIDYALYLYYQGGALYVFENGVNRGQVGTYAAGDRLRVAVEGGVVKYRKNGALLYEGGPPAQYPLSADTSLYHPNATITDAVIAATATTDIRWIVSDHLGTPRMVFDQTGSLAGVRRHDYLPFGEEIGAGVGGRTTAQGYSQVDSVRQKFTGYERDAETGLDYAQARYYASAQGRFIICDPLLSSGRTEDPRTWNRYVYTLNNPLRYTDPLGLFEWEDADNVSKKELKRREKFLKAYGKLKQLRDKVGKTLGTGSEEYVRLNKVISAIGEEGDDNGVLIKFGETRTGSSGTAEGPVTDLTGANTNEGEAFYRITLDLNKAGGDFLTEAIGHEGDHVRFLQAGLKKAGENNYKIEFAGLEVSSFIQEAQGKSRTYEGGGGRVWRKEWKNVDREKLKALRRDAINHFLSTNKRYRTHASPPSQEQ